MWKKYAELLCNYSLYLKEGERVYISSTFLAEELVREVYREALKLGAYPEIELSFNGKSKIFFEEANEKQLAYKPTLYNEVVRNFDAALFIRAPYNHSELLGIDRKKQLKRSKNLSELSKIFSSRTAEGTLKRSLCEFPTLASAQVAGMSFEEYQNFIFNACKLNESNPVASWEEVSQTQDRFVSFLNKSKDIRYVSPHSDISFSVENRIWINSDGKANMPSGEVFTGPLENSVNGHVYFDYPAMYRGEEVKGVSLEVKNGEVVKWSAENGGSLLNEIMEIEGARKFGEVAIGTNYSITRATKNILFDEKIGGTIHMALGQSYKQTGGINESVIHWDLISDMTKGSIYADGQRIYDQGKFLI